MKNLLRILLLAVAAPALAGNYIGDYAPGDTVDCNFGTVRPSTGASFTLAGTPAISAYKDNGTTESTSGITLSADFDTRTGMNHVRVTTASDGTFYSAGAFIELVITTGTVDSVSVVGQPVCSFTLNKVSALRPTTAARTLDVSSGGEAGVDWANVGSPTTAVNLSATTISTSQGIASVSGAVGSVTGAVGSVASGGISDASFATTAGAFYNNRVVDQGTAQAATGTTLQLRSAATFADSELVGATVVITGGTTGVGQSRTITAYTGSTDTATVATWTTTPTGTITYKVFAEAPGAGGAVSVAAGGITASSFASGAIDANAIATDAIGAAELAANALGSAEIANDAFTAAKFDSTAGAYAPLGIVDQGTAQAATATTLQLRSAATFADSELVGSTCLITGGSAGVGQSRTITAYTGSTDTATVATWTTTPTGTITYKCFGTAAGGGSVSIVSGGITSASFAADAINAAAIAADAGTELGTASWATTTRRLTELDEDNTTIDLNASAVGSVAGAVGSVTGAVGSVTGAVGSVTGSVGSIASGGISEASFATTAGSFRSLQIARQGTAQSATATTLVLDAAASFADDTTIGMTLVACGSTQGYCQAQIVSDYVSSTDTATVGTWTVTPSGTITYYLFGTAPATGGGGGGLTASDVWTFGSRTLTAATNITSTGGTIPITSSRVDASVGAYQTGLAPLQPTIAGRTLDVTATGEAGIDWANIGSPTTSVNLSGTTISTSQAVASVAGNVSLGTDSIGSAQLATTAVTEMQTGLATSAAIAALNNISTTDIANLVVEDQGATISLRCVLAALAAYAGGDVTTSGASTTYKDPSGSENRITGTVTSPGNRNGAITCPTIP